MTTRPSIAFARFSVPGKGSVFVLSAEDGGLGDAGKACDPAGVLERAFPAVDFNAKFASVAEVLAPEGTQLDRLLALGVGKTSALDEYAWLKLGGTIAAALRKATDVTVVLDLPGHSLGAREAASLAAGLLWDVSGARTTFIAGAVFALLASALVITFDLSPKS